MSKVESGTPEPFLADAFNLVLRISISRGFMALPQTTHFSALLDFQSQHSSLSDFGCNLLPFLLVLSLVKRGKSLKAITPFIFSLQQEKNSNSCTCVFQASFVALFYISCSSSPSGPAFI